MTEKVIGCAIEVHRPRGPGLLESTYEQCLARELRLQGMGFQLQMPMPVEYQGVRLDGGYRVDVHAEQPWILERKAVKEIKGIHEAPLPTSMKLAGIGTGLLINFNVELLKDGIKRFQLGPLRPLWWK